MLPAAYCQIDALMGTWMRVALVFFFLSRRRSWRSCSVLCRNRLRSSSLRCWPPKLICLRPEPGAWLRNMAAIKGLYNLEHLGVNATLHPQFKDAACNLSLFSRSLPILFFLASLSREQITCQFYIFFLFFPLRRQCFQETGQKREKQREKQKQFLFKERRERQEMMRHRSRYVLPMMAMRSGTSRRR